MGRMTNQLAALADRVGVFDGVLAARRHGLGPTGLLVVLYHRVSTVAGVGGLDPDLVDATPEEFDAQMAYLARHFVPVCVEEVLAAHRGARELPAGAVLVTFDDGYRDNHEIALPILSRHGLRALFFISTGHVTDRRLFWWERLSLLVKRSTRQSAHIDYPMPDDLDCAGSAAKLASVRRLNRVVKDHYGLDLDRFCDHVGAALGVEWDPAEERALAEPALMSWDEVRALRAAGMGIGSHTRAHRVLQTLEPTALADELTLSRATLERELGEPVTTIAYPVGRPIARIPPVRRAVAAAGYELGFTTTPGLNAFGPGGDPLDLKRLPIDRGVELGLKRAYMAMPFLAS